MLDNKNVKKIVKMMYLKPSLYFFLTLFISCSVFQNNNKKSQQLNELEGLNNYQKKPLVKIWNFSINDLN